MWKKIACLVQVLLQDLRSKLQFVQCNWNLNKSVSSRFITEFQEIEAFCSKLNKLLAQHASHYFIMHGWRQRFKWARNRSGLIQFSHFIGGFHRQKRYYLKFFLSKGDEAAAGVFPSISPPRSLAIGGGRNGQIKCLLRSINFAASS